jgi:hypothetical protein
LYAARRSGLEYVARVLERPGCALRPALRLWLCALALLSLAAAGCDESLPAFARPPEVDAGAGNDAGDAAADAAISDGDAGAE